jgi:hypothetical protein
MSHSEQQSHSYSVEEYLKIWNESTELRFKFSLSSRGRIATNYTNVNYKHRFTDQYSNQVKN